MSDSYFEISRGSGGSHRPQTDFTEAQSANRSHLRLRKLRIGRVALGIGEHYLRRDCF